MKEEIFYKLPIVIYKSTIKIESDNVVIESLEFLNPDLVEKLSGYKEHEFLGPNFWFSKIHPDDRPHILSNLSNLENDKTIECEYSLLSAKNDYIFLKSKVYLLNTDGRICENIGFVLDITREKQLQENLNQSLEMFKILSDKSSIGMYMIGKNGFIYVNDFALNMLGFKRDELHTINPIDLFYDENDKRMISEVLQKRFLGERFSTNYHTLRLLTKDKSIIYVNLSANTVKYNNEFVAFGVIVNITDQLLYNQLYFALKEINKLITSASEKEVLLNSICEILSKKLDFELVSIGQIEDGIYKSKYASSKSHQILSDFYKIKISVDSDELCERAVIREAFLTKKIALLPNVINMTFVQRCEYSKKHSIISSAAIPIMPNGELEYILLLHSKIANQFSEQFVDVLEEIQNDLTFALEKIQRERYTKLIDAAVKSSSEWVLITDSDGKVEYVNDAVCAISKYTKEELIGKNPRLFKFGQHSMEFYKQLWTKLLSGEHCSCTFINRAKDGSVFYLNSLIIPIIIDGKVSNFVDLARDITKEIKHLETIENLSNMYATLSEVNQLLVYAQNEKEIFDKLVKIIINYAKFKVAYVALVDENNNLEIVAQNVQDNTYKPFLDFVKKQFHFLRGIDKNQVNLLKYPAYKSIKFKRVYIINDTNIKDLSPFNKEALEFKLNSCCSIPIIKKNKAIGAIVGLSDKSGFFNKDIYNLLKEIALDLSYALDTIEDNRWHNIINLAIESGYDFIGVLDQEFKLVYVNEAVEKITGYNKKELIGKHHSIFSSKTHTKEFSRVFYETLTAGKTFTDVIVYKTKDGKFFNAITTIVPYVEDNQIKYYISIGKDITQERQLYEKINYLTNFDSLTSLPNRRAFLEFVDRFIKRAEIENKIGAVVIINPVGFGNINKAYGYEIGDKLLKAIANRLSSLIRQYDVLAKLESDKFAIVLKDLLFEEDSLIVVVNILNALSSPFDIYSKFISLSFNAGVSLFPKDAKDAKSLLEKAEIAIADAKEKGEGALGFYRREVEDNAKRKVSLRHDIRKAITNREFICYYQPYFSLKQNRLLGAECLLRWQKENSVISPLEFIPFLEETGLILNVEDWLRNDVMEKIARRKVKIPISINISPISFKQRHFVDTLISTIKSYNIDPSLIVLEVLERTFIENVENFKKILYSIKSQSIKVALDDFGTGYSSLSYLSDLPFDYIKIDMSFIQKILFDSKARSVVETIINLSHKLNIKTIAEGVEEQSQVELLTKMGCYAAQGYLFSKPLPEDKFELLLKEQYI